MNLVPLTNGVRIEANGSAVVLDMADIAQVAEFLRQYPAQRAAALHHARNVQLAHDAAHRG